MDQIQHEARLPHQLFDVKVSDEAGQQSLLVAHKPFYRQVSVIWYDFVECDPGTGPSARGSKLTHTTWFFPLVNLSNTRPSGMDSIAPARIWLTTGSYRLEVTSYLGSVGAWLSKAEI